MKKIFLLVLLALFVSQEIFSQLTTRPAIIQPGYSGQITIVYDPSTGNGGMAGSSKCYVHTGLITSESANSGDWKYPIGTWRGMNQPQLSKNGDVWELVIPNIYTFYGAPDSTEIVALALVFHDGPGGSREGKTSVGKDFYIDFGVDYSVYRESSYMEFANHTTVVEVGMSLKMSILRDGNEVLYWNTSNPAVATVRQGVLQGKSEGIVKISATANNISDTCYVIVQDAINITTNSAPINSGSVVINRSNMKADINAIPNYGYHFIQWSDGNTDNPRTITLTQDTTFTAIFAPNMYNVSVTCDSSYGQIYGESGEFEYLSTQVYKAVPNYGYHFTRWSDGSAKNPYSLTVTRNIELSANFAPNVYSISAAYNPQGTVSGTGYFTYNSQCTIEAVPNYGYHFLQWSDGNTDNPRAIELTRDTIFAAEFAIDITGVCGDNNQLVWTFDSVSGTLAISGKGALNSNYTFGLQASTQTTRLIIEEGITSIGDSAFHSMCATVTSIALPSTVTTIGNYAFAGLNNRKFNTLVLPNTIVSIGAHAFDGASYLKIIHFGSVLEEIGDYAFNGCTRVQEMTCLAEITPNVGTDALTSINSVAKLYVPEDYLLEYQIDDNWSRFQLNTIGATETTVTTNDVGVEADDNTATLTWPTSENADSYTIEITKDGVVFCTLIFNANGQLTGIAFAPSRNGVPHAPSATFVANGMQFTVTGLNSSTNYDYSVVAKNGNAIVASYSGSFATTGSSPVTTDVDQIEDQSSMTNIILLNGQILILRGDKTYTVTGQEVK